MDFIFNTPGIGGLIIIVVLGSLVVCYFLTLKWISKAGE